MAPPPLRAVFFDIDDTLYPTTEFAAGARRQAMEAMAAFPGVRLTADGLLAELREVIAEFGPNYASHYDRLLRRFPVEDLGGHSRGVLVAAGVVAYHDHKQGRIEPFPGVREALAALRGVAGLRLGVVTEGLEVKQHEKLLRLGVYGFLDPGAVFVSDAIGISKPNPKLWLRACAAVGVDPAESVYVGDNPEKDVAPARSLGMGTVRFRAPGCKHAAAEGGGAADREIRDFAELIPVLREARGLGV
jgi:putative hydrolase of the HAD superfamily